MIMLFKLLLLVALWGIGPSSALLIEPTAACGSTAPKNCTDSGLLCDTCTNLVLCIKNQDDGTFTKNQISTCPANQFCSTTGITCTTTGSPFCDGSACLPFPCQQVGIFPDPFYCNQFVMCVRDTANTMKPYVNVCPEGFRYNIASGLCNLEGECGGELPIGPCTFAGETKALDGNDAMYYICEEYSAQNKILYPVIKVCPGTTHFLDNECSSDTTEKPTQNPPTGSTSSL